MCFSAPAVLLILQLFSAAVTLPEAADDDDDEEEVVTVLVVVVTVVDDAPVEETEADQVDEEATAAASVSTVSFEEAEIVSACVEVWLESAEVTVVASWVAGSVDTDSDVYVALAETSVWAEAPLSV